MPLRKWRDLADTLAHHSRVRRLTVNDEEWANAATDLAAAGAQLIALWATRYEDAEIPLVMRAAFLSETGVLILELPRPDPQQAYRGLEILFPAASRMQRAARELDGAISTDPDQRPWLVHTTGPYPFVRVEGDGVHEIPVGPVHAGIIEPGHFRFSVVGEKVLRLEERLGYVHKGIEQRFTQLDIREGYRLAGRISGDSTVAYAWSYCQAYEAMIDQQPPRRALWLRALLLELERIANHLGDLGALGNDAGFAFGLAQFSRLKEEVLRANAQAFGRRYLFDAIVPGGTAVDITPDGAARLAEVVAYVARETALLREIYDEHEGVRDRFQRAGCVDPDLAKRLGLTGLAGRASGQAFDLRVDLPWAPYDEITVQKYSRSEGDVAARVAVRFDELEESCQIVQRILAALPAGAHHTAIGLPPAGSFGLGLIEGWRGPVLIALEAGEAGRIHRCHAHDPSWQNWPALEHAIIGNIVPDFPLINKSFNLSYSGHDL